MRRTNAHLCDDEAVAKMGHPLWQKGSSGWGGVESLGSFDSPFASLRVTQDDGNGKYKGNGKCGGPSLRSG